MNRQDLNKKINHHLEAARAAKTDGWEKMENFHNKKAAELVRLHRALFQNNQ